MPLKPKTLLARHLRSQSTDAERLLWRALREARFPWKLRRQHPVGKYVADFACPARKLIIELDGGQHAVRTEADDARSAELARCGYRVVRFWNNEVLGNLGGVIEVIDKELRKDEEEDPPPPAPSALKGRGGKRRGLRTRH